MRGDDVVRRERVGQPSVDLFYTFSVSKPFTAFAVHLLAERGRLALDDPVAKHWPEYGRNGKAGITIRQVLTHRAGVPTSTGSVLRDFAASTDWHRSVELAAAARPRYEPGARVWYHILSFGFILGELVRRIDGRPIERFVADEFFAPLGMRDTFLGLPTDASPRAVPLISVGPVERYRRLAFNRPAVREAVIPAASVSSTARDLASFYRMLLRGGTTADGRRLLEPETIAAAREVSSDGEFDRGMLHTARWGTGVQLGMPGAVRPFGALASPLAFGHNGSNICNAWADPERDLVYVFLSNFTQARLRGRRWMSDLSDDVLREFPA